MRPIVFPFFFSLFRSNSETNSYLVEEGETVRHLVKSDLIPFPNFVPSNLCWTKSPPYVLSLHLCCQVLYIGLIFSNRGHFAKENVSFVLDLLLGEEFICLKVAVELMQNFYFIVLYLLHNNHQVHYHYKKYSFVLWTHLSLSLLLISFAGICNAHPTARITAVVVENLLFQVHYFLFHLSAHIHFHHPFHLNMGCFLLQKLLYLFFLFFSNFRPYFLYPQIHVLFVFRLMWEIL